MKEIVITAIINQWIKGERDMVMGYDKNYFVELMYWLYISYFQTMPGDLVKNQDMVQGAYHVE